MRSALGSMSSVSLRRNVKNWFQKYKPKITAKIIPNKDFDSNGLRLIYDAQKDLQNFKFIWKGAFATNTFFMLMFLHYDVNDYFTWIFICLNYLFLTRFVSKNNQMIVKAFAHKNGKDLFLKLPRDPPDSEPFRISISQFRGASNRSRRFNQFKDIKMLNQKKTLRFKHKRVLDEDIFYHVIKGEYCQY